MSQLQLQGNIDDDLNAAFENGQAEASRMAIARCLADQLGDDLRKSFLAYDRNMIIYDPRRTETHKPPHSSWGARRAKQKSKR